MKRAFITQQIGTQQGFALILAIVATLLCTSVVLVAGLSLTKSISLSPAAGQEQRVLAAAEAGIDAAIARIEADLLADQNWAGSNGAYDPAASLTGELNGATFTVTFLNAIDDPEHDAHHVTLQSTAVYGENRCTVRKGLTRNAQGGNFSVFCNNNGGFDNTMASAILGNVYTNANVSCGMPVARKVQGRVYHRQGVGLANVDPLEGARAVNANYHLDNSWIENYRNQWQAAVDLLAAAPHNPSNANWGGGRTFNFTEDHYFNQLTFNHGPGPHILSTVGLDPAAPPVNLIFKHDKPTTLWRSGDSIIIAPGSRLNLIFAGPVIFQQMFQFIDQSDEPTGLFFLHDEGLLMQQQSRIYPTRVRLFTRRFRVNTWGDWYRTHGNRGELTFYIQGPFTDPTPGVWGDLDESGLFDFYDGVPTNSILANIILDNGARLYANRLDSIWGRVYCFGDSQLIFSPTPAEEGGGTGTQATAATVISDNPSVNCSSLRFSSTIRENSGWLWDPDAAVNVRNWTQPPRGAPLMLGLNPAGTGGYSSWSEVR